MKKIILLAVCFSCYGCATFTSPARVHELENSKSYWMDYDVTRRGTVLSASGANWKACAEPAPDAAIGVVAKLEGSLEIAGQGEGSGKGELTQSIVNLAEKTQMVLFLRESLFRLCELSINQEITTADAKELYSLVINAALELVKKEAESIKLEQQRLASANRAEFIYQYLSDRDVNSDIVQALVRELSERPD